MHRVDIASAPFERQIEILGSDEEDENDNKTNQKRTHYHPLLSTTTATKAKYVGNYYQQSISDDEEDRRETRLYDADDVKETGDHQPHRQTERRKRRSSSSSSSVPPRQESALMSGVQLLSESRIKAAARMDPERDLKRFTNHFHDSRMEDTYQLYSSTCDFPIARRIMLFLLFFQLTAYVVFLYLRNRCTIRTTFVVAAAVASNANDTSSSMVNNQIHEYDDSLVWARDCFHYDPAGMGEKGYTTLLWMFAPFAFIYGLLPLKYFEGTMRLRFGVYFIRRHWKTIAAWIVVLWAVGLAIYAHHVLFLLRSSLKGVVRAELPCASDIEVPLEWYVRSQWRTMLHNGKTATTMYLQDWIVVYDSKITYSIVMGVLAVLATVTGILATSLKLDFTHVFLTSLAQWATTMNLSIFGPSMSMSSRAAHNVGNQAVLFLLCVLLPTCFTLMATYSEDRAARMAYASKRRAERINTTLKLDLSVKRMGLENRQVSRDDAAAMEAILKNSANMELLMNVSIPFSDLQLKELISKNPQGEVILGEYHGTAIIIKRLALSSHTADGFEDFKERVELLACLRHPNIVQFLGATFDNISNVGFVMEYLERGDVFSLLRSSISLTWNDPLLKIATDVAQGMSYLHNCDPPLVHRDLKSSNLLCTATYSCKISDFGESKRQTMINRLFSTIVGTPYWLAPEILREEKYDIQVDCYSFGVVLIELETRKDPYYDLKDHTTIEIMLRVARGDLKPTIPSTCSPNRRALILRCLDTDPKRRPKMAEILRALQHEVREELLDENGFDNSRDKRRRMLMQRHQMLNRRGIKDLLTQECHEEAGD